MLKPFKNHVFSLLLLIFTTIACAGCHTAPPAQKPDSGPVGKSAENKENPPLTERFNAPPKGLYDMEAAAGETFSAIGNKHWSQAQNDILTMEQIWAQTKPEIGDKKGVQETDKALLELKEVISQQKSEKSYKSLNKIMASVAEVAKSYKLSPLSDLLTINNDIRNVSFYAENSDWKKAATKMKELEGTWHQVKPSMEQVGILGEITKTHSIITQMKDAVEAENKGSFDEQKAKLNESLNKIRLFYYGR